MTPTRPKLAVISRTTTQHPIAGWVEAVRLSDGTVCLMYADKCFNLVQFDTGSAVYIDNWTVHGTLHNTCDGWCKQALHAAINEYMVIGQS